MLNYIGTVIRPPSEANSLILQITLGCSDNNCTFCPAYKDKLFKLRKVDDIKKEIESVSRYYPETRKVFLADGDAIVYPQKDLLIIFGLLRGYFPKLSRISLYASCKALQTKSVDDLKELKENKLGIVYLGIESGDNDAYKNTEKFGSPELNIEQCLKVKEAGIKLNTTIILGLGGMSLSSQHASNTAKVLNLIRPEQVAALTLMITKGTKLYKKQKKGEFLMLDEMTFLKELEIIISNLENFKCQFFSNHASNYFPIRARFPRDKETILTQLKSIIETGNHSVLRPEFLRGL